MSQSIFLRPLRHELAEENDSVITGGVPEEDQAEHLDVAIVTGTLFPCHPLTRTALNKSCSPDYPHVFADL